VSLTSISGTADANTRARYGLPENRQLDIRDETFALLDEYNVPDWAIVNITEPGTRQLPLSFSWKLPGALSRP
jgi:hypothetical protein